MKRDIDDDFFSRERAAGYDPNRLAAMRALLIGAGALGQNCALDLALAKVGELCLVDFDHFETHNATRSPCFPSAYERRRWGTGKAAVVAKRLRKLVSWSNWPRISFASGPVQQFGDGLFTGATVAISAVDSNAARVYIGGMCRKHKIPLVEGGFDGADISYCVLANTPSGPCWLCHQAVKIIDQLSTSCTARAAYAEQAGFVPATQPAAAVLGALMAEAAIQFAHGSEEVLNRRVYLNTCTAKTTLVRLTCDAYCQGRHVWPKPSFELAINGQASARELLARLAERMPSPRAILPHRYVAAAPCTACHERIEIGKPDWILTNRPLCNDCGGSWQRQDGVGGHELPLEVYTVLSQDTPRLLELPLETIGIVPGCLLEAEDESGASVMFAVSGSPSLTHV